MDTKEMLNSFKELQEAYQIDVDLSGSLLIEFQEYENN